MAYTKLAFDIPSCNFRCLQVLDSLKSSFQILSYQGCYQYNHLPFCFKNFWLILPEHYKPRLSSPPDFPCHAFRISGFSAPFLFTFRYPYLACQGYHQHNLMVLTQVTFATLLISVSFTISISGFGYRLPGLIISPRCFLFRITSGLLLH